MFYATGIYVPLQLHALQYQHLEELQKASSSDTGIHILYNCSVGILRFTN